MTEYELFNIQITLENERGFYEEYVRTLKNGGDALMRERLILRWTQRLGLSGGLRAIEQQVARIYFDERYAEEVDIKPRTRKVAAEINDFIDQQTQQKEDDMSHIDTTKSVQTITYVYGKPIDQVSDDTIFQNIAGLEAEIKKLEAIQTKPKKLVAKIDALKAEIQTLVDVVDSRA